jgi:hypothetical protein
LSESFMSIADCNNDIADCYIWQDKVRYGSYSVPAKTWHNVDG